MTSPSLLQAVGGRLEAEVLQNQVRRGRDGRGVQEEGGAVVRGGSVLGPALLLPGVLSRQKSSTNI